MYESKSILTPNDIVVTPMNYIACFSSSEVSSSCTLINSLNVVSYCAVRPYLSVVDESSATEVSFSLPPLVITTEPLTM
jgi:hypothetical protein